MYLKSIRQWDSCWKSLPKKDMEQRRNKTLNLWKSSLERLTEKNRAAKKLGRGSDTIIGTIPLHKILNFESSANTTLLLIRKSETHI